MFSLERIHNPGDAIMSVTIMLVCLLVASYPVIKMMGWWLDGGAEPLVVVLSIFMYFVLIIMAASAVAWMSLLIFGIIAASAVITPTLGKFSNDAQLAKIDNARMDAYKAALERNPMDPGARLALAEALYKKGETQQAMEHMEWTYNTFPGMRLRIRPVLDSWKREQERIGMPQPIICHECVGENAWNATHCYQCGAAFGTRKGVQQQIYQAGGPRVVLRGWILTCVILFTSVGLFLSLPPEMAGLITLAVCIVTAWLFLRWVGADMGTIGD